MYENCSKRKTPSRCLPSLRIPPAPILCLLLNARHATFLLPLGNITTLQEHKCRLREYLFPIVTNSDNKMHFTLTHCLIASTVCTNISRTAYYRGNRRGRGRRDRGGAAESVHDRNMLSAEATPRILYTG